jgi:hypothetical protein
MNQLLQSVDGWHLALLLGALFVGTAFKWVRLLESRWRLTYRRSEALRQLLARQGWQHTPNLLLQFALIDAFGGELDRRELAFIETRSRPLTLLRKRVRAGLSVRLKEDGSGYEDRRESMARWLSLNAWSNLFAAGAAVTFVVTVACLAWAVATRDVAAGLLAVETAFLCWMMFQGCAALTAAHQVVSLHNHPPVRDLPGTPQISRRPRAQRRKPSAKGGGLQLVGSDLHQPQRDAEERRGAV